MLAPILWAYLNSAPSNGMLYGPPNEAIVGHVLLLGRRSPFEDIANKLVPTFSAH